jgi:CheY-like chemotaxis protein
MLSAVDRPALTAPVRRITSYLGLRRTIVVVDDNADHRALMREVLIPMDFTVFAVPSGADCLSLLADVDADLFLIDISMPGMNGWELAGRLRETGQMAPIIMLSANIGDGSATGAFASHNDTLAKPFVVSQLVDKLAVHLDLAWIHEGEERPPHTAPGGRSIMRPDFHHVQELIRLGEIGYIRGIEAKLTEIALAPEHQSFVEEARTYVQAFDLSGYDAFLRNGTEKGGDARG